MQTNASPLTRVPTEVLERIALELALSPALDTSITQFHMSSSNDLYAKIFLGMFDVGAARRRFGTLASRSRILASQLKSYCVALKRIRRGDLNAPDIEDLLRTVFILLTENDGKNREQLEWANAYQFANNFVHQRLWQDTINGWPRDTPLHSLALWVLWCMTDADKLALETPDERNNLIRLVLPYVVMSFKYSSFFAPDNHLVLPLPDEWEHRDIVSLETAHGQYPVFPSRDDPIASVNHFGRNIRFRTPPVTAAARLLYFSRREMIPLDIPSVLPLDWPTAIAQGIQPPQTQADIIEVNSHAGAQFVPPSHWDWKSTLTPEQRRLEEDGIWRRNLLAPSAAWDNDWERFTACWDPWADTDLKGTVYTFGSMDGPLAGEDARLVSNPVYPEQFGESSPFVSTWPFFMRLKEHHCINPQEPVPPGGTYDDLLDDGVRNAWFPTVDLFQSGGRVTVSYQDDGEAQRSEYETYTEGLPNSHNEDTCITCQYRREHEEPSPMVDVEDSPLPRHSDYEDDFAEAGLGRPSYGDDDEDTYEANCTGIRDIIFTGATDPYHSMAWGRFTFLGRVRPWDGLLALVRVSTDPTPWGRSKWVFRGYLHYGKVLVGSWRGMTADARSIPWEGPFVASKRVETVAS
ncbi:hypothetical protein H4582DRAFT_1910428 [Lactarius indigo]|nr:hypothetical protein H4582DRAFT_1910428 [Lactarius indigo]